MVTEIFELNGELLSDLGYHVTASKLLKIFYNKITPSLKEQLDKENAIVFLELSNGQIRIDASDLLKAKVAEAVSKI